MVDMPPPPPQEQETDLRQYYRELKESAENAFREGDLAAPCVEALCNIKELKLRALITAFVFQQTPQEANVSRIKAAVLPTLGSYYVRGAEAGAQSVLGTGYKVSREDALESEEWTHRPEIQKPKPLLEQIFNAEGTRDALDKLNDFEKSLFKAGYEFGKTEAEAEAFYTGGPGSDLAQG
jgi:hypothetical protein